MSFAVHPAFLHGGDYNPEQWGFSGEILDRDFELMAAAGINAITVGVFAWASLEPREGEFVFDGMDEIFARAGARRMRVILATPSGGKPHWLGLGYPEVRRVSPSGAREPQGLRHNHCPTSPVFRDRVRRINTELTVRYGKDPALALWHVSNEYMGYCHCDLCLQAFQNWLEKRYETLDRLNDAYWSSFWSHTYGSWDQIRFIDWSIPALCLDWKRFMTDQCADFLRAEAAPLRKHSPCVPITTNFHGIDDYNYFRLAEEVDVVSWDSYPDWHSAGDTFDETAVGAEAAFRFDLNRGMKNGRPFLLMECTPSQLNWRKTSPLRRPGLHRLSCLQAVAHGADAVCYFQIRKGRGGSEKHHGAVVDHVGHGETRTFRDVAAVGDLLKKLSGVAGARTTSRVAVVFDWENLWAIERADSPQNAHKEYRETCLAFHRLFGQRGIAVDVLSARTDFSGYDLVVLPMLYLLPPGLENRLSDYVAGGGTVLATYQTGYVNETDLCFTGGVPGPLKDIFGLWVEEFDALPEPARRAVVPMAAPWLPGNCEARHYLDIVHCRGAEVLAAYAEDFYAGCPVLTRHAFGNGRAYYLGARMDERFLDALCGHLGDTLRLPAVLPELPPAGVTATLREKDGRRFLFLLNFTLDEKLVSLPAGSWIDLDTGEPGMARQTLGPYGAMVFQSASTPPPQPIHP